MHRKHFFVPATGAPAGDYELYLLGLDWLPEAIQPCCASGECGSSAPFVTRTTAERLVLHGLWPRYDPHRAVAGSAGARGAAWPEYCARSGADFTACCGEQAGSRDRRVSAVCERAAASGRPPPARCALPRAVADAFNTSGRWQAYAPEYAHSRLASHQWAKHGSCTRWTAAEYFAESEKVHARLVAGVRRQSLLPPRQGPGQLPRTPRHPRAARTRSARRPAAPCSARRVAGCRVPWYLAPHLAPAMVHHTCATRALQRDLADECRHEFCMCSSCEWRSCSRRQSGNARRAASPARTASPPAAPPRAATAAAVGARSARAAARRAARSTFR